MRRSGAFLSLMLALIGSQAFSASSEPLRVELNVAENVQNRCRLSFVIENKGETPVESLKLDLAVFGREGIIQRRLVAELGPVYRSKTIIKAFEIEGECGQIGSIQVNDIVACAPGDAASCLDRLNLSSRVKDVSLFK
jgi:hypothetical protein